MSDDQENNPTESHSDEASTEEHQADEFKTENVTGQAPIQVERLSGGVQEVEIDPGFDDRDVRVPYGKDDDLAEPSRLASFDPLSIEAMTAKELDPTDILKQNDLVGSFDSSAQKLTSSAALGLEDDDEGQQMAATDAAIGVIAGPAEVGKQLAHTAFMEAVEAHASALGLKIKSQSSYTQFLHDSTGHKIYVGRTVREGTPIRIESTLELVGVIEGASPIEKVNGKIAVVLRPQLEIVMQALSILASGSMGPVRAPRRTDPKPATK